MSTTSRRILVLVFCLFSIFFLPYKANAESYGGIGPDYTLNDIMAIYPNAKFEDKEPAWVKSGEYLYGISGSGIQGEIIVKFNDQGYRFRTMSELPNLDQKTREMYESSAEYYGSFSLEKRLKVEWVRWLPDIPFPVSRLVSRYGKPTAKVTSKDDFRPYWVWSRGVGAILDDSNKVIYVDFNFTQEEIDNEYEKKTPGWKNFVKSVKNKANKR